MNGLNSLYDEADKYNTYSTVDTDFSNKRFTHSGGEIQLDDFNAYNSTGYQQDELNDVQSVRTTHKYTQNNSNSSDHNEDYRMTFNSSMHPNRTRNQKNNRASLSSSSPTLFSEPSVSTTTTQSKNKAQKKSNSNTDDEQQYTKKRKKKSISAPRKKRKGNEPVEMDDDKADGQDADSYLDDDAIQTAYGKMSSSDMEELRSVLEQGTRGDFSKFVKNQNKSQNTTNTANVPPKTTTTTNTKSLSLDEMQSELVYHKKKIHKMMSDSIKMVQTKQPGSCNFETRAKSSDQIIREELSKHDLNCEKYIALISVLPKAPRSRGFEIIFGMVPNKNEQNALNTICTCTPISNPRIEPFEEGSDVEQPENSVDSSVKSTNESFTQNKNLHVVQPEKTKKRLNSYDVHPDIITMHNNPENKIGETPNVSQISSNLVNYIQSEFGDILDIAHMDIGTFLAKTCPCCLYGGYSAKGTVYMEAIEEIKDIYRRKAFSTDHSTLAISLCNIWNTQVFTPLVEAGVKILPFIYEIILDHIKRPHVIDATLMAKSEVDDITSMQMGIKQMIFQKVISTETIEVDDENQSMSENNNNIIESRSSNDSSTSSDESEVVEIVPQQKKRLVVRTFETTKYNTRALDDYMKLSRLKLFWLHSKKHDTVFNAQGRKKQKNVFNPHNSQTTLRISSN